MTGRRCAPPAALALAVSAAALVAQACGGVPEDRTNRRNTAPVDGAEADTTEGFAASDVRAYMRQLAPYFVSRELEPTELAKIDAARFAAIAPMLETWSKESGFPRAARRLIAQKLSVSGNRDGIDFDLPGNLAEHLVRSNLPLSELLTADYCVDASGSKRACDSGAPFQAGVLTTRAFMVSRASRFNLTRASTMLDAFACRSYPMPEAVEPRLSRSRLIPMFQVDDESGDAGLEKDTFGNGSACYSCHGQFGAHAQLFVRFDETGLYRADATGLQDPNGELGRATNGLFASHMLSADEARGDGSQMFGSKVRNLSEAAKVLATSPSFVSCQVTNLLEYALRLPRTTELAPEVLEEISASARKKGDPTFASLVVETFSHPRIVAAVANGLRGAP